MTRSQAMVCAGLSPQAASASVRAPMARAQGCPRWACSLLVTRRSRAITLCIASQPVSQPDRAVLKEDVYVHCPGGGPALGRSLSGRSRAITLCGAMKPVRELCCAVFCRTPLARLYPVTDIEAEGVSRGAQASPERPPCGYAIFKRRGAQSGCARGGSHGRAKWHVVTGPQRPAGSRQLLPQALRLALAPCQLSLELARRLQPCLKGKLGLSQRRGAHWQLPHFSSQHGED